MARTTLVYGSKGASKRLNRIPKKNRVSYSSSPGDAGRPHKQDPVGGLPLFKRKMLKGGLSQTAMDFMQFAWQKSTRKVYSTYLHKWTTFCLIRNYDMYEPEKGQVIDFLISPTFGEKRGSV